MTDKKQPTNKGPEEKILGTFVLSKYSYYTKQIERCINGYP